MSSDDLVLSVKNISKCFEMYEKPVHRLYQTLCAGHKRFYKEFWALRDISFEVRRGECLGIIGRNGAGKSTLLQIITGTLQPTYGSVEVNGRVAALLELGSGFNPEFTGRENVYLNASILGLSREETDQRYQSIVDFADIGDFIDQPVKTYSSGMMVRLAFAVQVSVTPEILIVDEALAVGDVAFQSKCMKRMQQLLEAGCSIVLVTHDISTVRTFCGRAIWIKNGILQQDGMVELVTCAYLENLFGENLRVGTTNGETSQSIKSVAREVGISQLQNVRRWGEGSVRIVSFQLSAAGNSIEYGKIVKLCVNVRVENPIRFGNVYASFSIRNKNALDIMAVVSSVAGVTIPSSSKVGDEYEISFEWRNDLSAGSYTLVLALEREPYETPRYIDFIENAYEITVISSEPIFGLTAPYCQVGCKTRK